MRGDLREKEMNGSEGAKKKKKKKQTVSSLKSQGTIWALTSFKPSAEL